MKDSARDDRRVWLSDLVRYGDWEGIKSLRKPKQPDKGRLRDLEGNVVENDQTAETLA